MLSKDIQAGAQRSRKGGRPPGDEGLINRIKGSELRGWLVPSVILLTFLSILTPIGVAPLIAYRQSFAAERQRAHSLATEVERRTNSAAVQIAGVFRQLQEPPAREPCSAEGLRRMASAALESEQIQGAGYISGNRLVCTSAALLGRPIDLGAPQFYGAGGYAFRTGVKLPFAQNVSLTVIAAPSGYAVFQHPKLVLDLPLADEREAIGVIGVRAPLLINHRGPVEKEWFRRFYLSHETHFVTNGRMVSIQPSKGSEHPPGLSMTGDYAGFAILPVDEAREGMGPYLLYLLPVGLICGAVLIFLLRILVRAENSLATIARRALKTDEFYLRYQPLVELETGRWVGAEALVRWRRPTGEEMRPDLFVPYLEEAGLIPLLTDKVFEMLAADVARDLQGREDFHISINVTSEDLRGDRLMDLIETLLARIGCGAGHVAIEVTERCLVDVEDGGHALKAARDRGVRVALDDFGTGYSSLSYLQNFALDYLKIDRSFVDSIATGAATSKVVGHIINMAQDLKLGLIAEGVETEEQSRFLIERGVAYGQGWLFARPMPWAQLIRGVEKQQHAASSTTDFTEPGMRPS